MDGVGRLLAAAVLQLTEHGTPPHHLSRPRDTQRGRLQRVQAGPAQ